MTIPMVAVPRTVEEYLEGLTPDTRLALQRLRKLIKDAAPDSEECLVYGMPTFRVGKMRLSMAAFKDHCSLYGWARVHQRFSAELKPFVAGRGTLRFTPARPLPPRLVTQMVQALLALNASGR
jgi:uncharacterized protein YdhG (YjbR/CyaY superfamily)